MKSKRAEGKVIEVAKKRNKSVDYVHDFEPDMLFNNRTHTYSKATAPWNEFFRSRFSLFRLKSLKPKLGKINDKILRKLLCTCRHFQRTMHVPTRSPTGQEANIWHWSKQLNMQTNSQGVEHGGRTEHVLLYPTDLVVVQIPEKQTNNVNWSGNFALTTKIRKYLQNKQLW